MACPPMTPHMGLRVGGGTEKGPNAGMPAGGAITGAAGADGAGTGAGTLCPGGAGTGAPCAGGAIILLAEGAAVDDAAVTGAAVAVAAVTGAAVAVAAVTGGPLAGGATLRDVAAACCGACRVAPIWGIRAGGRGGRRDLAILWAVTDCVSSWRSLGAGAVGAGGDAIRGVVDWAGALITATGRTRALRPRPGGRLRIIWGGGEANPGGVPGPGALSAPGVRRPPNAASNSSSLEDEFQRCWSSCACAILKKKYIYFPSLSGTSWFFYLT